MFKIWHVARSPYEVVHDRTGFSGGGGRGGGGWICHKNWENGAKVGQKQGLLNLLKNLGINFYWICSIMKIYLIGCAWALIFTEFVL